MTARRTGSERIAQPTEQLAADIPGSIDVRNVNLGIGAPSLEE